MHTIDTTTSMLTISCDCCVMQYSAYCADCVVTHVISPARPEHTQHLGRAGLAERSPLTEFTDEELHVVANLVRAGMVPTLLHRAADHADL